jgi:hypothetical protein
MRISPHVWVAALVAVGFAHAQTQPPAPKPADKPKASAVKLPDGTVVFVTRGADDPNPIVDGVVLSAAEYQALVDQVEAAKRAKENAKPVPPSGVTVRGAVEARGGRRVAALTLTFTYRTTLPRTLVTLGCQRAAVVAAAAKDGTLPVLAADADGLTVLAEAAGEHTLTVQAEVPVSARTTKGEVGFDLGLPRAAISTFALDRPPADGVAKVNVGTRGGDPPAVKRATAAAEQLAAKPLPLGPTDFLEVSWEPPGTASADPALTADADVQVRVDETQVETTARLRLRGAAREWQLTLPPTAEVNVAAGGLLPLLPTVAATVVKPPDPTKPWVIRTPGDLSGDWLVTVTARQPRPEPADPKFHGPYPVGPFAVNGVRPTGKVAVYAPPGTRLGFKPAADLRRQDLPPTADDDQIALFATAAGPRAGGWLDIDARTAAGLVRVRPQHKLKLTPTGWKLESTVRVVPPQRTEIDQLAVELPAGWGGVEVSPVELVDAVTDVKDGRWVVRFATPQKAAVEFTLTGTFAMPPVNGTATLPLPRFPQAEERDTKLTATVGEGLQLSGTGFGWENGQPAGAGEPLKSSGRGSAATAVTGEFDRGPSKVELRWQPYRPELGCEVRAEATVSPRQVSVTQTFKFTAPDADVKVLRFRGPAELVGLRAKPPLDPTDPGAWEFRPPADAGKEFTLTVQYAVRLPSGAAEQAVPLLWCDTATRTEAVVRVWGGGGPRADGFTGGWRELPPEPAADRDSLPWFTLAAGGPADLTLTLSDHTELGTVIDRGLVQASVAADGTAKVRARYLLTKWPGGGVELDLPPAAAPEVLVDGKRAEPVRSGERLLVTLPEVRAGGGCVLDVLIQGMTADSRRGRVIVPPAVPGATYRGPVRWYVACPADSVPLVSDAGWDAEHRWGWRGYGVGPLPADSPAEMEEWFRTGHPTDRNDGTTGDAVAVRRATADPLRITLAPRWTWLLAASGVGLVLAVGVALLRPVFIGPAVAVLALGLAAGVIFLPQPTAQAVAAAQPGLAIAVPLLAAVFGWRWYWKVRTRRVPTFSRVRPPSNPAPTPTPPPAPRSSRPGGSVVPFEAHPS